MSNSLRLSDLLARSVAVEWHEAVALVREVTDRLLERSGAQIVSELHQIELAADGQVSVSGGTRTDEPVRRRPLPRSAQSASIPTRLGISSGQIAQGSFRRCTLAPPQLRRRSLT